MSVSYFHLSHPFELDCGKTLPEITLAYQTYGQLNSQGDNVIWVCHALTGNAAVEEWWPGLVGPGALLDTERYFIICANMLGSCYGSTYALSVNPATQQPYFHDFPLISIRDMIRAYDLLRQELGIRQIYLSLGGSMGGQQVLEWAIEHPGLFKNIVPIATNARHSPWGIAFNESQRMAIEADDTWTSHDPRAGLKGMKAARAMALLSYRHYQTYAATQQDEEDPLQNFKAVSYQRYQGEKLVKRFDAFAYWTLTQAMDSHNVGRNRQGIAHALNQIRARCLVIGVDSDVLFPPLEQQYLGAAIPGATYVEIPSKYGHDGFLIETETLTRVIRDFLAQV